MTITMPLQRPGRSVQTYATPRHFLEVVKRRLEIREFLCDFAADEFNTAAAAWFDEAQDALRVPRWADHIVGGWGWLNPPFANIAPWAAKCVETKRDGGSIAFLVPASVGANWFRDSVDGHARVLQLNGRLDFIAGSLYPKDCILALYSPAIEPGYQVWRWR